MCVDIIGYVVNRLYVIQSQTLFKIEQMSQEYGCHYLVTRKYINNIEWMLSHTYLFPKELFQHLSYCTILIL